MKKYSIIVAVIAAFLALCAAVWPKTEALEEKTPAPPPISAVSDPAATVEATVSEAEIPTLPEKEMVELPQAEPPSEVTPQPESVSEEIAATPEVQPTPEPEAEQERESAPASITSPTPPQAIADPQPGDMVDVPGFGWLESQGPGEVIQDENIYENGNKIGIMG